MEGQMHPLRYDMYHDEDAKNMLSLLAWDEPQFKHKYQHDQEDGKHHHQQHRQPHPQPRSQPYPHQLPDNTQPIVKSTMSHPHQARSAQEAWAMSVPHAAVEGQRKDTSQTLPLPKQQNTPTVSTTSGKKKKIDAIERPSKPVALAMKPGPPLNASGKPCAPFFFYKDYSTLPDPDPTVPVTAPGRIPNFPAKMYAILSRTDLSDIISWMPHGRSWKVLKPREFEVKVIPTYFEHSKFSSFIRQANGWGFRRMISKGPDRNSYYHEKFLRGAPHLVKIMKRPPPSSKPVADPSTEPNFYEIEKECPLPKLKADDDMCSGGIGMGIGVGHHHNHHHHHNHTAIPSAPASSASSGVAPPVPVCYEREAKGILAHCNYVEKRQRFSGKLITPSTDVKMQVPASLASKFSISSANTAPPPAVTTTTTTTTSTTTETTTTKSNTPAPVPQATYRRAPCGWTSVELPYPVAARPRADDHHHGHHQQHAPHPSQPVWYGYTVKEGSKTNENVSQEYATASYEPTRIFEPTAPVSSAATNHHAPAARVSRPYDEPVITFADIDELPHPSFVPLQHHVEAPVTPPRAVARKEAPTASNEQASTSPIPVSIGNNPPCRLNLSPTPEGVVSKHDIFPDYHDGFGYLTAVPPPLPPASTGHKQKEAPLDIVFKDMVSGKLTRCDSTFWN